MPYLGTGLSSDVRGYFRTVIDFINRQDRPVFAVDIASGLNADTGQVCGTCIQATATATFGFCKSRPPSRIRAGRPHRSN
jgi:NAD(P)H-hydrate repair Nnr-like enzyme with NAD(P)H-hydrate epimerase domain